jgi:hypothetical protein
MAIAFDAPSNTSGIQQATLTVSHTCTGSNRVLIAMTGVSASAVGNVSGVTYNGVAMTPLWNVVNGGGSTRCTGWYLIAPDTGTHDLVATFTGGGGANDEQALGGVSYTGVNQTVAVGTHASASGSSGTASVDVNSASGELVVDGVYFWGAPITEGANQTKRWENENVAGIGFSAGQSEEAGAATVTMSWGSGSANWVIGAVPLKKAGTNVTIEPDIHRNSTRAAAVVTQA